ncbi:MAG: peptidylprolyl isomerase [Planctomycetota bacterium]|jgi:hypothetical protein
MYKCIFLSVLMLFLIGGCDGGGNTALTKAELERISLVQKIELAEAAGELVLVVGSETVTSDEIIESPTQINRMFISPIEHFGPVAQINDLERFKELARGQFEEILTDKISNVLLYQHARMQAGKNIDEGLENAAESEYRKFVLDYGGDQIKADEVLKKSRMDRENFKEQQKKAILIQWYMASKLPVNRPATYRELMDCYDQMKDEYFARVAMIQFRLIDIQPDKLDVGDPNADRWQLTKELADQLLARIKSGEDFGELAKQYSHGDWREFGGLWRPVQPASLAAPYDILAAEADKIEPDQVAGPVATEEHIFILKLEVKQSAGYEPFEKVQELVEEKVLIDRRKKVIDRLNARIRRQAELSRTDEFIDFCLEKIHRISNQQQ